MKYGVEGYHFQITAVLEAGQQFCVLPNTEPVIQPVETALQSVESVGLSKDIRNT
jgi:hypothetical protein